MAVFLSDFHKTADAQPETRGNPLVLITEDDEDTRLLFRITLGRRGYAVIEAADGENAVLLAESACPDVVLMDGSLPRLDGLGATRRIRQLGQKGMMPIIFISGHAEPAFRAVAREAGCDEYLVKPVCFDQLDRVIEKYLGHNTRA
jgi:CheY-like chemotaxis protein